MAGFTGTKSQEDIKKNEENKNKKIEEKNSSNKDIYSASTYEEAKSKYGQGVGNNKYFMPKDAWEKGKAEQPKKEQSLVANQFGEKKGKTWNDVLTENGNDPEKTKDWLNNNPDYKAGELTKKGMSEFGYTQGEDGKWGKKTETTTDTAPSSDATYEDTLNKLEELSKENEDLRKQIESFTNKDGSANEQKTLNAMSQYEQKLAEMGVGSFDEDGKFVFKDTTKKGWEDWATMLSVGASVIGLAMGVPIVPINFRKITNKDEKDAKIREFQKQYADVMADGAAKVKDVESSKEAGDYIKKNQESIDAFTNYVDKTASYKARSDINTDSEKELIETRTNEQIRADEAQFERTMEQLKAEQDFALKVEALREQYKEQFAALESALSTGSAKELMMYKNAGMFKEMEEMGITPSKLATWKAAQDKISPADKNWNRFKMGIDAVTAVADSASKFVPGNKGK